MAWWHFFLKHFISTGSSLSFRGSSVPHRARLTEKHKPRCTFSQIERSTTRWAVLGFKLLSLICIQSPTNHRALPPAALSTLHHPPHAHSGLTVWFVHRCPGGRGELPEQTDAGACWWEPVRDQPPAPKAPESLQFGSLPSKVKGIRGMLPALPPRSMFGAGCVNPWAERECLLFLSVLKTN